jgi:hypothetical protein
LSFIHSYISLSATFKTVNYEGFKSNQTISITFLVALVPSMKIETNVISLCYHEKSFGITAGWHFYATSHGKGLCDDIYGAVKQLAGYASLKQAYSL